MAHWGLIRLLVGLQVLHAVLQLNDSWRIPA